MRMFFNQLDKSIEEARSTACKSLALFLVGEAEILAGESSGPDIGTWDSFKEVFIINVVCKGYVGPMFFEHALTEFVFLTLENHFESGALEAEIKASDSSKK
jgi:hypothetical protein